MIGGKQFSSVGLPLSVQTICVRQTSLPKALLITWNMDEQHGIQIDLEL
jgi:hypothetical protein